MTRSPPRNGFPEWSLRSRNGGPIPGAVASEVHLRKGKGDTDKKNAMNLLSLPLRGFYMDRDLRFAPTGCAFMVSRLLFPEGPFEGDYFLGGEDAQVGFRLQDAHRPVVLARGAKVFHGEGEKPFRLPGWKKEYYAFRNRYLTLLTFYRRTTLLKLTPLLAMDGISQLLIGLFFSPEKFIGTLAGMVWILTHPGWLTKKRAGIQEKRSDEDRAILGMLSGRILDGEGLGARIANLLSLVYCRWAFIPILESMDLPSEGNERKNLENPSKVG